MMLLYLLLEGGTVWIMKNDIVAKNVGINIGFIDCERRDVRVIKLHDGAHRVGIRRRDNNHGSYWMIECFMFSDSTK